MPIRGFFRDGEYESLKVNKSVNVGGNLNFIVMDFKIFFCNKSHFKLKNLVRNAFLEEKKNFVLSFQDLHDYVEEISVVTTSLLLIFLDPGMLSHLGYGEALRGILLNDRADEPLQILRDVARKLQLPMHNLGHSLLFVLLIEGCITRRQFKSQDTNRPQVHAVIVVLT